VGWIGKECVAGLGKIDTTQAPICCALKIREE